MKFKLTHCQNVTGIGFALSATDLLDVLHRFYPSTNSQMEKLSVPVESHASAIPTPERIESFGTVVFTEPAGAKIIMDHQFVGNIPATLKLTAQQHLIQIQRKDHADWTHFVTIVKDSSVTLTPD